MNWEHPDDQAGFRKGREARDQIANICWIIEKGREFQKNLYFCFSYRTKAFGYVDHDNLWRILKGTGISDHLTCLLRNLYAGQEATSRIGHGITDWFRIGKGVYQGCILPPCLFNLYAEWSEVKWSESLSVVQLFAILWTIGSMEFSRPEYWSRWSFPSPDLPYSGIETESPVLQADSLPTKLSGKSWYAEYMMRNARLDEA